MCILMCILMCIKTAGMHLAGSFLFVCEAGNSLFGTGPISVVVFSPLRRIQVAAGSPTNAQASGALLIYRRCCCRVGTVPPWQRGDRLSSRRIGLRRREEGGI